MDFGPNRQQLTDHDKLDKISYTVCAPDNLYHTCQYLKGKWYGMDNVCSSIDDKDLKWYTIRKLRELMLTEIEGKWAGFEWVPLD